HTGQIEDRVILARKAAEAHDLTRSLLKMSRALIISETGPAPQQFGFAGLRQSLWCGEARQEFFVVRDHCLRACRLQHDLRDEDLIGIAGLPPRQIALCVVKPIRQPGRERPLHYCRGPDNTCTNSAMTTNSLPSSSRVNSMASNLGFSGDSVMRVFSIRPS